MIQCHNNDALIYTQAKSMYSPVYTNITELNLFQLRVINA